MSSAAPDSGFGKITKGSSPVKFVPEPKVAPASNAPASDSAPNPAGKASTD
jgi:hypothetical protein